MKHLDCRHVILALIAAMVISSHRVQAYSPELDHRSLAGLWRLKQIKPRVMPVTCAYPLKEFTTYPKKKKSSEGRIYYVTTAPKNDEDDTEEMLLMLKEDGSFQQYSADASDSTDSDADTVVIPDKLKLMSTDDAVLDRYFGKICGKWDFIDGKLLLAADRPKHAAKPEDTLLVGEVVAVSERSLNDNPALKSDGKSEKSKDDKLANSRGTSTTEKDTHLSVPLGKVNVGKFFYPRNHPSFFEQPMFRPEPRGRFQLKQVLGSLNAKLADKEEEFIEKFRAKDFYDKVFSLTTHPLPQWKPKGNRRWSTRQNKFIVEPPPQTKEQKEQEDAEKRRSVPIRVVEVKFFSNNTFATVAGLGDSTVFRGKYSIIGRKRDQLWFQISRFGFGRSVSGSVFSEGNGLSKDDERAYWGSISFADEVSDDDDEKSYIMGMHESSNDVPTPFDLENRPLIVKGSVLYGYGLEPQPVARFILKEIEEVGFDDDEEDDDDDEEDIQLNVKFLEDDDESGGIDWSDAFQ